MPHLKQTVRIGDRDLTIETGKVAKQAQGSAWITYGETVVLVTACSGEKREHLDFFPLTVEYQEKLAAAGRIPGSFFRREGRPTEKEVLTDRVIDRSIRPIFPEGFMGDTQVIATVYSMDQENEADWMALTGASAALSLSNIPWGGPLAGVRVGRLEGKLIANPTLAQRELCDLDIIMAASMDAIVMVEGGGKEIPEEEMIEALFFGQLECQKQIAVIEKMVSEKGVTKKAFEKAPEDEALKARVRDAAWNGIYAGYAIADKIARYEKLGEVKKQTVKDLVAADSKLVGREKEIKAYVEDLKYDYMRGLILDTGKRIAGRAHNEVRDIHIEVGVLPRTHGSALFTRGETQALVATTLGTTDDEQRVELLTGMHFKKFMLHYNFPPFSVGEVKMMRSAGRREVGHGALAERALKYVLPDHDGKFPYTIRIVSDILESNGSSSMASVCGGCLSLMDAGVPIKAPVAGIAMGLVKEGEKIAILSDILGDEDHLGDMDFKVCGTKTGITSIQMDIKIGGLTRDIMTRALHQAKEGRLHILAKMFEALPAARTDISQHAPRITQIKIRPEKIKDVIGPGGKVIKDIIGRTGCSIDVEDDGTISIASSAADKVDMAIKMIKNLTQEPEVGKIYMGTVRRITDFGAFVEIYPGTDGLVHISELSDKRVKTVTDVLHEGDEVLVKVISIDRMGKIRLSRKEALGASRSEATPATPDATTPQPS